MRNRKPALRQVFRHPNPLVQLVTPGSRVTRASARRSPDRNPQSVAFRRPAFGILADPRNSGASPSFSGSSVTGNSIVTGPRTGFCFGLGLGNHVFNPTPATGTGASFTGNTLAGNSAAAAPGP
jgi:hypothetical protein